MHEAERFVVQTSMIRHPDHPVSFVFVVPLKRETLAGTLGVAFGCSFLCPCSVSLMSASAGQMVAITGGLRLRLSTRKHCEQLSSWLI